jgi:hypothetical protein
MSVETTNVINTQSFGVLVQRVNDLADALSSNIITTATVTDVGTTIGKTSGNAFVNGMFGSNTLYATDIRGGNISTDTVLSIVSNTYIGTNGICAFVSIGNNYSNAVFVVNSSVNTIAMFNGNVGSIIQVGIQNHNTGPHSSADYTAYNDIGKMIRIGIKGSEWSENNWTINQENSGYLTTDGDLSIGTTNSTSRISFFVSGADGATAGAYEENEKLTITNSGFIGVHTIEPDAVFAVRGTANVSGNVVFKQDLDVLGNVAVGRIKSNMIPTVNNSFSLGNSAFRYRSLYVSGSTIYLGTVTLEQDVDGKSVLVPNLKVSHDSYVTGNSVVVDNFTVGNATTLSNTLTVVNAASFQNTISVIGSSTFANTIAVTGAATLGNTLSVVNSTSLSNTFSVTGNSTFANTIAVTGNARFSNLMLVVGAVSFQNTLSVTNSTSMANTLAVTGAATFSNTVAVTGAATLSNTLSVTGATTLSNTSSHVGAATFSNTVAVTGAATFGNTVSIVNSTSLANTLAVTGAVTLSNTSSHVGAATFSNTLAVTGAATFGNTVSVVNSVTMSNTLAVTGAVTFGNTLSVTNSVTISNTVAITGDTRISNSTLWLYSNAGNYITVGNNSQSTVVNSSSITVSNVFATNIAGLLTTVNQTQIISNNSLNLDGQRGQYYINLSSAAYANALANAIVLAAAAYVNSVAYTDGKAATDLIAAKTYADGAACTALVAAKVYASDATNITSGTIPTSRLAGAYTQITDIGSLTGDLVVSKTITGKDLIITNSASFACSVGTIVFGANSLTYGTANIVSTMGVGGNANVGGDFRVAGDLYVTGITRSTGTSSVAGDLVPLSNAYSLGDIAHRFTVYGMAANFACTVVVSAAVSFGNTMPSANGVLLGNNTLRWTASANTIDVSNTITTANLAVSGNSVLQKTTITTANVYGVFTAHGNSAVQGNSSVVGQLSVTNTVSFGNTTINGKLISLNGNFIYSDKYTVIGGIGAQIVDQFDPAAFRSAEYIVQVSNTTHSQVSKLLVFHNGGEAYVTEYAQLNNPAALGTFSSTISGGNVRLLITPNAAGTPAVSFVRTTLAI